MKNKGLVIFITLILSGLCVYHLSFTHVAHSVQEDATQYATDKNGIIHFNKKQFYSDSIWNLPTSRLFGKEFTYKEIKDHALNFGLDLQGGMHFIVEVSSPDTILITRSLTVLRNRLHQFGISESNLQRIPNSTKIQIEVAGINNAQRVRRLLQDVARLEFWDVIDPITIDTSLMAINDLLLTEEKNSASQYSSQAYDSLQQTNQSSLFALSVAPNVFRYEIKDTAKINSIFKRADIKNLLPHTIGVYWANKPQQDQFKKESIDLFFLDIGNNAIAKLSGDVITDANKDIDELGNQVVSMTMNTSGTKIWAKWTEEVSAQSPKGKIAIMLDKTIYSAPAVNGKIPNGNSQISGNLTEDEALDLANVLSAGSLPVAIKIIDEKIIGPTIDVRVQKNGIVSLIIGLMIVFALFVTRYGMSGLSSALSLLFNIIFLAGLLAQLDVALTFFNSAGILLTLCLAISSNVLILEHIRERSHAVKKLQDAIANGFKKSFWIIFHSNAIVFLVALILSIFSEGAILSFAITLMTGTITTIFTSFYISRIFIDWTTSAKKNEITNSFQTHFSKFIAPKIGFDFFGKRKLAYLFPSIIIPIGIGIITIQGFNLGFDFKGGRSYCITFNKSIDTNSWRSDLISSLEESDIEIKNIGSSNVLNVITSYKINDDSETANKNVRDRLIAGLEKSTTLQHIEDDVIVDNQHFNVSNSSSVGATIHRDIVNGFLKATLISLVVIFLYIFVRFKKWQFGATTVVILIHNILFVFAVVAIARLAHIYFITDSMLVTAVLVMAIYTIHDVVIIFGRAGDSVIAVKNNDGIYPSLNRSVITSGLISIVVVVLLLFGGEMLRGFAFASLVGIIISAYTSFFIVAPLLVIFDKSQKARKA